MDLSKLSMSELQALQKQLETQLKSNPAKEIAIADAMKAKPMEPPARMMERLREAVAQIPRSESGAGVAKSRGMTDMLSKMTPEAQADVIARPDVMRNIESSIAKAGPYEANKQIFPEQEAFKKYAKESLKNTYAPMETPYGKSFLSYTPEGKIAGKTGAALRGLGKVASRVAGPLGAALTALDLAQGLGEVQEKGAAKIAEDYKKSKMAESEAQILTPEVDEFREGLKSRRTELEILRAELERKRQKEERDREREQRGIERQARVRDTLEKTGLLP